MRFALALGELEQREGAVHVHMVCGHRRELGPRGQQRRQVKYQIHLELCQHPFEKTAVGDRAGELPNHQMLEPAAKRRDIYGDDRTAERRQTRDQPVADLAAGTGHESHGRAHGSILARLRLKTVEKHPGPLRYTRFTHPRTLAPCGTIN